MVTVACTHVLTLNRSRTHTLSCAEGHVCVEKPWGKGNAHGLEFYVMIQLCIPGSDIVYCRL
jgi:hypothetical protein